jgi:phospholipid/cholesterol/gamma-HCH transport system ATP-binding protein
MAKTLIKIKDLRKSFGTKVILDGLNLEIKEGESLTIIGKSGISKSVLIKHIAMILEADSGEIEISGIKLNGISKKDRKSLVSQMGYLFQSGALFDSLTIWENIAFRLLRDGMTKKKARSLALEALQEVGLDPETANQHPSELSGGMQKRAALARAVITKPKIIFFDEPTTGLDPIMADVIDELILKMTKKLGATGITITHDIASVRKIADRVAMLDTGKIIWLGKKEEVDNADNDLVQTFMKTRKS